MTAKKLVEMRNITVEFPGVRALDGVKFDLIPGEVHVLLGENGAGKSTIMKVLAGANNNYSGQVFLQGEKVECRNVKEQQDRGISIIFQETNLLPNLTVAENIYLGRQPEKYGGQVDWKKMKDDARETLDTIGSTISEDTLVSELSVGQMQMVEIAKAISFKSSVIIMDEPTSALTEKEVDALFDVIAMLKSKGVGIVYISHRLEEIVEIGDRVTVFRDGYYIDTLNILETTIEHMISLMVGRELSEQYPRISVRTGDCKLEVENLAQEINGLSDISFFVKAGEIVGFYGLMGAGRTELMRCIFGADSFEQGVIKVDGETVKIKSCEDAKKHKIALLTEDRKNQGLILEASITENITLVNYEKVMNVWGINPKRAKDNAQQFSDSLNVKTPSVFQKTKNLSGGNQQKVVIAKWLNADPEILIFDEPTRGIDVGAKVEIYKIMNELKKQGKSIIMVSSDLPEAMGMSDRLYVMHNGTITHCFDDLENTSVDDVAKYATIVIEKNKEA